MVGWESVRQKVRQNEPKDRQAYAGRIEVEKTGRTLTSHHRTPTTVSTTPKTPPPPTTLNLPARYIIMQHLQAGHHLAPQPAALPPHHLYGNPQQHPQPQHLAPPLGVDHPAQHHLAPQAGVLDPDNALHVGVAKLNELRECVDDVSKDAAKFFDKGNKAAGVRARKKLQMLKSLAQDLRVNIQKCKAELAAGGAGVPGDEGAPADEGQVQGQQMYQHEIGE